MNMINITRAITCVYCKTQIGRELNDGEKRHFNICDECLCKVPKKAFYNIKDYIKKESEKILKEGT